MGEYRVCRIGIAAHDFFCRVIGGLYFCFRQLHIAGIERGLKGTLVLTSLPGEKRQLTVEKVTSVSIAEDASNYFRVEASINDEQSAALQQDLRPGMEGAAKLDLGERSLVWIWTHELINWLRLKAWVWLP